MYTSRISVEVTLLQVADQEKVNRYYYVGQIKDGAAFERKKLSTEAAILNDALENGTTAGRLNIWLI
jgi:hypothetical protein